MLDVEGRVKDLLETEYGIEDMIDEILDEKLGEMVERWMNNHDLRSYVEDAVELKIPGMRIGDAVEFAIEEFVENLIGG